MEVKTIHVFATKMKCEELWKKPLMDASYPKFTKAIRWFRPRIEAYIVFKRSKSNGTVLFERHRMFVDVDFAPMRIDQNVLFYWLHFNSGQKKPESLPHPPDVQILKDFSLVSDFSWVVTNDHCHTPEVKAVSTLFWTFSFWSPPRLRDYLREIYNLHFLDIYLPRNWVHCVFFFIVQETLLMVGNRVCLSLHWFH